MLREAEEEGFEAIDAPHQANPLELFWIAWRRKSLIFVGIAIGLVLGALYYAQIKPVYRSEAQVFVVSKRPEIVTEKGGFSSEIEDYANIHRVLIQSPLVVDLAVKEAKLEQLESFAGVGAGLSRAIAGSLSADLVIKDAYAPNRDSLLRVSFSGPVAKDCCVVVNAVLEAYKKFLKETYRDLSADSVKLITEARQVLQNDLSKTETEYRDFREKSPMIQRGKDVFDPRQERLSLIEAQRLGLLLRRV